MCASTHAFIHIHIAVHLIYTELVNQGNGRVRIGVGVDGSGRGV